MKHTSKQILYITKILYILCFLIFTPVLFSQTKEKLIISNIEIDESIMFKLMNQYTEIKNRSLSVRERKRNITKNDTRYSTKENGAVNVNIFQRSLKDYIITEILGLNKFDITENKENYNKAVTIKVTNITYENSTTHLSGLDSDLRKANFQVDYILTITDKNGGSTAKPLSTNAEDIENRSLNKASNSIIGGSAITELQKKMAKQIALELNLSTITLKVINVTDKKLMLTVTEQTGAKVGDIYEIIEYKEIKVDNQIYKDETIIGRAKITKCNKDFSFATVIRCEKEIKKGNIIRKIYQEKKTNSELKQSIETKKLIQDVFDSISEYYQANDLIRNATQKIKEGKRMQAARDFTAGSGTTFARHVSREEDRENGRMLEKEGLADMERGKKALERLNALYIQCTETCKSTELTAKNGKSIVGVLLQYKNGKVSILVGKNIYVFNDKMLTDETKTKLNNMEE